MCRQKARQCKVMLGGGIEKNHSCSSKKLVLSLVTISFLSSYSYATTNQKLMMIILKVNQVVFIVLKLKVILL